MDIVVKGVNPYTKQEMSITIHDATDHQIEAFQYHIADATSFERLPFKPLEMNEKVSKVDVDNCKKQTGLKPRTYLVVHEHRHGATTYTILLNRDTYEGQWRNLDDNEDLEHIIKALNIEFEPERYEFISVQEVDITNVKVVKLPDHE